MAKPPKPGNGDEVPNLYVLYPRDSERWRASARAIKRLRAAAESGSSEAAHNLAWMYRTGTEVEQDIEAAAKWYRVAADAGLASAQFSLGLLLISGDGIERDYGEALKWLSLAAANGDPEISRECPPYILQLSIALGPEKTGEAVIAAWHWQLSKQ
ncbi:MAG TPA: tetratricopeptide repeat protein [Bradyrhizobium sp.]|nr:tetratricopeptide repeat protein [Bradyrhizobium sp.]